MKEMTEFLKELKGKKAKIIIVGFDGNGSSVLCDNGTQLEFVGLLNVAKSIMIDDMKK